MMTEYALENDTSVTQQQISPTGEVRLSSSGEERQQEFKIIATTLESDNDALSSLLMLAQSSDIAGFDANPNRRLYESEVSPLNLI